MTGTKNSVVKRGNHQAADHRAAERRILLAAFAHPERHRQHADDHRKRRHGDGPDAREAGRKRRFQRILPSARSSLAKVTIRILFAVATPIHMIAPISDGTFRVVCVMNSIHRMPESAPGSAIRMMNGSSHD